MTYLSRHVWFILDLCALDAVLRLQLCKLLNEGSDWIALAERLALTNLVSSLKQTDNPSDLLLDNYAVKKLDHFPNLSGWL